MPTEHTRIDPSDGELGQIIHEYFMPEFRKGYMRVGKNKVVLPEYYLKFAKRIDDMEVRDNDYWVVSHPKTGNMVGKQEYCQVSGELGDILHNYFTNDFRKGYVKLKGVTLPKYFTKFGDKIHNLEAKADDVWVTSFPKTGTTWTQEMVWCIANDLDLETAKRIFLPARFPFLEHSPLFDYEDILPKKPDLELPSFALDSVKYINELPSPRFIKTHLPWSILPSQIQTGEKKPKIVYVARNAKDTCVSYYHHCRLMEGYKGNFNDFCKLFLGDSLTFTPFWSHVLDFWKRRDEENILFIKYEDMKKDLPSIIRKTAEFFKKDLTEDQVAILNDHLSFQNMKNNKAVNYEEVVEINRRHNLIQEPGQFMRSGKVGEWQDKMTDEMIQKFDRWTKDNLIDTGLEL